MSDTAPRGGAHADTLRPRFDGATTVAQKSTLRAPPLPVSLMGIDPMSGPMLGVLPLDPFIWDPELSQKGTKGMT